jgi:peptidoglycan hydrolase-like protein with peptidoglycan-binding domain
VFENISKIVDEIFDSYLVRQGSIEPLFTQFCNGTTSKCDGLSQWGTVTLAEQGLVPYEILQNYYGDDINIIENVPVEAIDASYPGYPLKLGDAGNDVSILQVQLNAISRNYPAIPKISELNGIFNLQTENAVRKFQEVFFLDVTGAVDSATWYKIKRYYVGVKRLAELDSLGVTIDEASVPFGEDLRVGDSGIEITTLQYYLNVIAYFNPSLNLLPIDSFFGVGTENAVKNFQSFYGLEPTGIVNEETWNKLKQVYNDTTSSLVPDYSGSGAKAYPGYFLTEGMRGQDVTDLQTYLSFIADNIPQIPKIAVDGVFGAATANAVRTFQSLYGLEPTGAVGPVTWFYIGNEYDFLKGQQG